MSYAALTAKYRPQTFAQVAGQDTLKSILSRASLEGRVAPAYLFSGTRGVGKTTLARIFAKALNCRTAPTSEPCNQCDQCRAVTTGTAVDVVEIDGASNRGIDDVRRLKEVVGYAPMEGRYKIFIIDEAHMLSREAFNALLKTLEEPPAGVTFIMATTEPHKFPATIISRCQHYVFKRLPENGLVDHLISVLEREGVAFEANAVRLIARRGAGSVRDSMSLLGQVLALGEDGLTEASARGVLGLAGQEAFMRMIEAFRTGDTLTLSLTLREMLDQGLDMGFFLRELSSLWRNMFILKQSGQAGLAVVELPENESRACLESCRDFSLQHIHACWQMTLEGQRRVLTSLEPALALELLLLNLAMLPQLLSLENLSALGRKSGSTGPGGGRPGNPGNTQGGAPSGQGTPGGTRTLSAATGTQTQGEQARPHGVQAAEEASPAPPAEAVQEFAPKPEIPPKQPEPAPVVQPAPEPAREPESKPDLPTVVTEAAAPGMPAEDQQSALPGSWADSWAETWVEGQDEAQPDSFPPSAEALPAESPNPAPLKKGEDWQTIFSLAEGLNLPPWLVPLLRRAEASWNEDTLVLTAQDEFSAGRLKDPQAREAIGRLLAVWCGVVPALDIRAPTTVRKSREELQADIMSHPLVKEVQAQFGARIIDYGQMR